MKIKYIILALFLTIICLSSLVYYNTSTVHKYKKLVKVYTNAVQNAVEQNGAIDSWKINNAAAFFQFIKTDLNIDKICRENDENESCFIKKYPRLNNMGTINMWKKNFYKFTLKDGSSGAIYFNFPKCDISDTNNPDSPLNYLCGSIWFDVNGLESPNVYGIDLFQLLITKDGVLMPRGHKDDAKYSIEKHCKNRSHTGDACGAWILEHGNQDYLE